jgi:hypothetical protein
MNPFLGALPGAGTEGIVAGRAGAVGIVADRAGAVGIVAGRAGAVGIVAGRAGAVGIGAGTVGRSGAMGTAGRMAATVAPVSSGRSVTSSRVSWMASSTLAAKVSCSSSQNHFLFTFMPT